MESVTKQSLRGYNLEIPVLIRQALNKEDEQAPKRTIICIHLHAFTN
uniref:Uncharacterized protein n=1 Tax=Arundo donax TaxID=35708 RepID=A0A0A8ZCP0_ARUDO